MENKLENIEIINNKVVNIKTVRRIECEWDGKEFSLKHEENTYNHKFSWLDGADQFNAAQRNAIEKNLYEETEFYLPTAEIKK